MLSQLETDEGQTIPAADRVALLLGAAAAFSECNALTKAESVLEQALVYAIEALGPKHAQTGKCYGDIGIVAQRLKKFDSAVAYLEKALAIQEEVFGELHMTPCKTMNNLAGMHYSNKNYAKAIHLYRKVSLFAAIA